MTFGTNVCPVHTPRLLLLFTLTQKGRGKMAAKRQVPMGIKSSKFVVGKRKSVDVWRTSKATKKVSWCKTRTQKGRGKMAAKGQSWSQQFECLNMLGYQ